MCEIYNLIKDYKKISIIGMGKNVGKTTLLNKIISVVWDKKTLGITSIGRDGEEIDLVTDTPKPRIYVKKGTILATAKNALKYCDITQEILEVTDFVTPMGNIVVVRALSDGYVDIAGPSYNTQIIKILESMEKFGANLSIVDGALSRKGSAAATVCQGNILVTGAAISHNMDSVIESTVNTVDFLTTECYNGEYRALLNDNLKNNRGVIVYEDGDIAYITGGEFLTPDISLKNYFTKRIKLIGIKGAVTDKFIEFLIKNRENYDALNLIGIDGTKFFINSQNVNRAKLSGISFKILESSKMLFVTCNPTSPMGYTFPKEIFKKSLEQKIDYPVINVMEE